MPKYKNISDKELWLPGIGKVKAGGTIKQPDGFNNANFKKVEEAKTSEIADSEKEKKSEEHSARGKRFKTKEQ